MKKILIIFISIIILFGTTGCGIKKKTTDTTKKVQKQVEKKKEVNMVGTYTLFEMHSKDQSYTEENLKVLKDKNLVVIIEIKENKTASLDVFGTKQDLTYDDKYFYSEGDKIPYTYNGGILKLSNEEQSLSFRMVKEQ